MVDMSVDMSNGGIFLIHDDGGLVEMHPEPFASEDILQKLLAGQIGACSGGRDVRTFIIISAYSRGAMLRELETPPPRGPGRRSGQRSGRTRGLVARWRS
jgi:hypothetical protein